MLTTRVEEVSNPKVEFALDSIGREFGESGRMPDYIKISRSVQRDSSDLVCVIEGLHSLLGESKQHVQGSDHV